VGKPLNLPFDPIERAAQRWEETWGPASAMRVATSIMRAQQILLARYDELLKPHRLTFARYEVLVLLRFSRYGALPLGRIGERLMVHPTSVTNSIDRLEAARFVERLPNRPGEFPFTRGLHADRLPRQAWTIRQFAGFGNASRPTSATR
jgi:hypothetical protein